MMTREQYLFQCLSEELSEVAKECLKASRFGPLCDWYEGQTNLSRANVEWSQVHAIMSVLHREFGHSFSVDPVEVKKKLNTFEQFYDHSVQLGMVKERNPC